ncbi:hypothetical protein D9M71_744360 [compost metagenome]
MKLETDGDKTSEPISCGRFAGDGLHAPILLLSEVNDEVPIPSVPGAGRRAAASAGRLRRQGARTACRVHAVPADPHRGQARRAGAEADG